MRNGGAFSDYVVYNPDTGNSYKVAIRSADNSANFCECNDFKTNRLGTCKHIEATFFYIQNKLNKGHLLAGEYRPSYTSIYLDYRNGRKAKIRIGTEYEKEFNELATSYFDNELVLKDSSFELFNTLLERGKQISDSFRCYPDALDFVIETRDDKTRQKLVAKKYRKNIENGVFNPLINIRLFPYQKEGVCFATEAGRCVIADDMGLGKTLQAIAAAQLLKKEIGIAKVFIICPTSLKYQWKSEIEKFTGEQALVIEGIQTKRIQQYSYDHYYKIVSYHTAVNDIEYINNAEPDLLILDEAQRIKNFKTKISRNVKKLTSTYRFVLTGTPLENKLEELYSIVQFIDPFILGPYYRFLDDHQVKDERGKIIGYQELNAIGNKLKPVLLRRKKKDVLLQLPERMDKILYVPMTPNQSAIHDEYKNSVAQLIHKWKRQGFLKEKDRQRLMIFLNMMRIVCDSTYILDQETRHDTKIEELMNILQEFFDEGEEKAVVFSQWERMTRIVAMELDARNIKYEYLHGGIPSKDRAALFQNFNNDPECKVFLSTDAGGVGLNLQAASMLINLDIPWNPAVLEQRIARIYRLGQKRNVSIINMVATETIEHRMLGIIGFKKELSEGILDQGENTIFLGEDKFKKFMDTVEKITVTEKPEGAIENIYEDETLKPSVSDENRQIDSHEGQIIKEPLQGTLFGDDDIPSEENEINSPKQKENSSEDLIQSGISFIGRLAETLSDPEETKKLVSTIVKKDEKDGKAYLKIPVENEKIVENAIALLGTLMQGMKK